MNTPRKRALAGCISGAFPLWGVLLARLWRRWTVSRRLLIRLAFCCSLWACATFAMADDTQEMNRQFQAAVAQYDAGKYAEAAAQLENLLPRTPNSFEVRELLGMTYASLSQDAKAIEQLQAAVRLKPDSAAAHTNLAASLSRSGKSELAGEQFRKAFELEPGDYSANHNLGEFYIQSGKIAEAQPLLERAQQINPESYDNGYDLAQADLVTGRLADARQVIQGILEKKNTGELHNLLGQVEEKDGKFVAAANEFEAAAHMDPSEDNLFYWGSELLLHRTYDPAIEVFRAAVRRYPQSPRLQIGLGMALYSRGLYEESVTALLAAADLSPSDPRCYMFLSKAYDSSPKRADEVIQRFRRYAELEPRNALAQYYYAMSLWKGKRAEDATMDLQAVEAQLKRAIALDGKLAEAHMQLGGFYADEHNYQKSIPELERALELNPNLPDAHYRLGTDYVHVGQKERAQSEFAIYQKLRAEHLAEVDKERAAVQQFVYSAKGEPATKP
jgi:tetratricopeptide (TPR) repeat protein